ncbi:hypothetical protein NMY22_g5311 [Coprinellus aureogranulatus]|nr:hypothetical protein NMY22_g5311 [Coprinellus aureogranulatus]
MGLDETTNSPDSTNLPLKGVTVTKHRGISTNFTSEKLDKSKDNFVTWHEDFRLFIESNMLAEYLDGEIECPDSKSDPTSAANWRANDRLVSSHLKLAIERAERDAIKDKTTAKDMLEALKKRHQGDGAIQQTRMLLDAFNASITSGDNVIEKVSQICTLINQAFDIGNGIKRDTLKSIALFNAIGSYSDSLRTIIASTLSTTHSDPNHEYAPQICAIIEREYTVRRNLQSNGENTALAAQSSNRKPQGTRPYCVNCKLEGHSKQYCIAKGGDMEGKLLRESREQREKDRTAAKGGKKSNGAPKSKIVLYSSTGEAFIVDSTAATQTASTKPPASNTSEFAGLASYSVQDLARDVPGTGEEEEYNSWIAEEEEHHASVDWAKFTTTSHSDTDIETIHSPELAAITQEAVAKYPLDSYPFWADTGASTHISPDKSDFINLTPVAAKSVKGIGGSAITAIARGDISVRINAKLTIVLRGALYIPTATVRLISVSKLARDSKLVGHFDDEKCWITNKGSNIPIAVGMLHPTRNLYTISQSIIPTHSAFLTKQDADFETWHRRLGHANYQAIMDMARKGMIEGMPKSFDGKPAKCEHCILGKQARNPVPKVRREGGRGDQETREGVG